jgi:hypothetical protein
MGPPQPPPRVAGADRGGGDAALTVPCDAAAPDAAAADAPRLDAARGASNDHIAAVPRVSASSSAASSPRRAPAAAASPHRSRAYAASSAASSAASGDDYSDGSDCDEEEEEAAGANYASAFGGGSCADLAAARHGRSAFRVLDDDAIVARQAEAVAAVDAVLHCGQEEATLLLRHFRWAPAARVHEEWFQARLLHCVAPRQRA